ncbi:MAG: hypothetical protein ACLFRR_09820 [Spirochaetaceae bacterium]
MTVREMLEEHGVGIDDIRWYLAGEQAQRLLTYKDRPDELTRLLWSGQLESELYEMEERFIVELEEELQSGRADEAQIHQTVRSIARAAEQRRQ